MKIIILILAVFVGLLYYQTAPKVNVKKFVVKEQIVKKDYGIAVEMFEGDVNLLREGMVQSVQAKMVLKDADQLNTGVMSSSILVFGFGSKIRIFPESEVVFKIEKDSVRFIVHKGSVVLHNVAGTSQDKFKSEIIFEGITLIPVKNGLYFSGFGFENNYFHAASGKGSMNIILDQYKKEFVIGEGEGFVVGNEEPERPSHHPWVTHIPWRELNEALAPDVDQKIVIEKKSEDVIEKQAMESVEDERKKQSNYFIDRIKGFFLKK